MSKREREFRFRFDEIHDGLLRAFWWCLVAEDRDWAGVFVGFLQR
jgi:hypothetical protein